LIERLVRNHGTELFNRTMALNYAAEGSGREGITELARQQFNLNYTNTDPIYSKWRETFEANGMDIDRTTAALKAMGGIDTARPLPNASSPELEAQKTTQAITNWWTQTGISHWDRNFPTTLAEELAKAIREYRKETGEKMYVSGYTPADTSGMSPLKFLNFGSGS